MAINIEIKSTLSDYKQTKDRLGKLGIREAYTMYQKDIFYQVPFGRLKLRNINNTQHELIIYFRNNTQSPKPSKYYRISMKHPGFIHKLLGYLFGVYGIVEKERLLFLQDNIRFHMDKVKGLGNYFEIEYVMDDCEVKAEAQEKVNSLLGALGISNNELISESYIDLVSHQT